MKIDPPAVPKDAAEVSNGSLAIISLSTGENVFALKAFVAGDKAHGFAILETSPQWVYATALSVQRAIELPGAELAPQLDPLYIAFSAPHPIEGALAIVGDTLFLAASGGTRIYYIDISGHVHPKPPVASAVWCTCWKIGYRRTSGFTPMLSFPAGS